MSEGEEKSGKRKISLKGSQLRVDFEGVGRTSGVLYE